jgi:glycosyltransferase involved in cell wall biosynthesis
LTVIIPFLNEGAEVENTIRNIRNTSAHTVDIILIDDASNDGFDYSLVASKYGCVYIRHDERRGVAASRDEGVELCRTPYFLLLDAHMEFYRDNWDLEIVNTLWENPDSILCCQTRFLNAKRETSNETPVYGARLLMGKKDIFKAGWVYNDPDPKASIIEIPVILGGAYATRRDYWLYLHGLHGLINYGSDEELISLKCWTSGGRCLLLKDLEAGHIYRKKAPYEIKNDFVLGNKIFITELFFNEEEKQVIQTRLKAYYGKEFFRNAYDSVINRGLARTERKYLESIRKKDLRYFLFKNNCHE